MRAADDFSSRTPADVGPALPTVEPVGDRALILRFGDAVQPAIASRVQQFATGLLARAPAGVRDIVPAFTTVTVHYEPTLVAGAGGSAYARLRLQLLARVTPATAAIDAPGRIFEIPVCYGGASGPDLDDVARQCGMDAHEVVTRHMESAHRVYMLGFAPGFPFIGGLDPRLFTPRRATPRTQVPAGSVAIAREQTCIYTLQSPGGWNLIGRTPTRLFDANAETPCLLGPGDAIRFVSIDEQRYDDLMHAQADGASAS
jgi:inhibitor of KinA